MFSKGGKRVRKKCGCSSEIKPIHFYLVIYHFLLNAVILFQLCLVFRFDADTKLL